MNLGVFITPSRVYDGHVRVLDNVATTIVTDRQIATDTTNSKLIYFVMGDDGGGGDMFALHGDSGPSGAKGLKGDSGDRGPAGSRAPTGKRGNEGPGGPPGKIGKMGPVGARGGAGARGGCVGQQWPIYPQGSTGPRGNRGATVTAGPKGDTGVRAVDIDIVAELCKHLPVEMVKQYRRGAYVRYAINSMKDIEVHDATHVKTIIDKGGRCNATQSDVTRMTSLPQTRVNSNCVLNFHNDAYNMDADMAYFHCVFGIQN